MDKLITIIEKELEDMVTQSWSVVQPRVKSINGSPKGKKGKDDKGNGKGKKGKGKDGKGKEPRYQFTEAEDGCTFGQHCAKYHRLLKQEERRCYICGSQKHMAGECDKPKKDDSPIKGSPKAIKAKTEKEKPQKENQQMERKATPQQG